MSAKNRNTTPSDIQLSLFDPTQFNDRIRRTINDDVEVFSLVDLMSEFSDLSSDGDVLWTRTKKTLQEQGFELDHTVIQLALVAKDGKKRKTACADGQTCLRIIQSIPSAKAEPIREWLASLGYDHIVTANKKARDLQLLEAQGYTRTEASDRLTKRVEGQKVLDALKDALNKVANGRMLYGSVFNAEYMAIFGENAKSLEVILNSKSVRDGLPALQLAFLSAAEMSLTTLVRQQSSMTTEQVIVNVNAIMIPIGHTLRLICDQLGIHHITGKPMLESGIIISLPKQIALIGGGNE